MSPAQKQPVRAPALIVELDDAIGPAKADYVSRGIDEAVRRQASLVIIRMDTPGGLDTAMRAMIRDILASPVPMATYVSPSGARAASAGTFILYASHIAAMAPRTNVGAATPVQIGGLPGSPGADEKDGAPGKEKDAGKTPPTPRKPMEAKAVNDAAAYLRSLAGLRGRNANWAERAVRDAASLSATAALAEGVIDIQARDIQDLLEKAHGRIVTAAGRRVVLDTRGLVLERIEPGWRTRALTAGAGAKPELIEAICQNESLCDFLLQGLPSRARAAVRRDDSIPSVHTSSPSRCPAQSPTMLHSIRNGVYAKDGVNGGQA